jgi:Cdc6-like AAA superfamily ATPase
VTAPDARWTDLDIRASQAFSPGTPIKEKDLFSGRKDQIRRVVDAVNQAGQHVVIFGERGVGKTSLSRVLAQFLAAHPNVIAPSVNCESADTFETVWRKVFNRIDVSQPGWPSIGFSNPARQTDMFKLSDTLAKQPITADVVRDQLEQIANQTLPIIIIDEFDRLTPEVARSFADTIKNLSDHTVGATVILVGVGDSIDQLIEDHASVARALKQIQMPRMAPEEISGIIQKGLAMLGMTISPPVINRIVLLARGLPHYAHLIGLHGSRAAIDARSLEVDSASVNRGIEKALQDAQQKIRTDYRLATQSVKKHTLFSDVLLASALAEADERGFFTASAIRKPLRQITGRNYEIPNFAQHLAEFSGEKRGFILRREGENRYKYRFSDPLMQPYVIMLGLQNSRISHAALEASPSFASAQ